MSDQDGFLKGLKGKKILFLAPAFFGYEYKIKAKMEEMGASVDYYDERCITRARDRALLKITPKLFITKTDQYYHEIMEENKGKEYDFVFVVKCEMITKSVLKKLKKAYAKAVFCLYLWDSIENIKGVEAKFPFFDRIFTFDRNNAQTRQVMRFRPLFFTDDFCMKPVADNEYRFDICFVGTIHSDRYAIIQKVKSLCEKYGYSMYTYAYLQSKFIYYYYKWTNPTFRNTSIKEFSFGKMSSKDIAQIIDDSKVVLDIQHPKQTGLTMRTIEMVGMNKKLITTNGEIAQYDFYDPDNIHIIHRDQVELSMSFLEAPYRPIEKEIYEKYSLEQWIRDILLHYTYQEN